MKRLLSLLILSFFIVTFDLESRPIRGGISLNYFYHTLAPYGEWIEIDYDVYVWRPNTVHYSWSPYSIGRWHWTVYGWYWDSYEPFGWATYHYGRWFYDDYYGWIWMPDSEWGPAWVEWRYNDGYIGWAPLPPYASFRRDMGIHFSISWQSQYHHWHFVTYNRFCDPYVNNYFVDHNHKYRIYNRTKYRTNYYHDGRRIINRGVDRSYVERRAGRKIRRRDVVSTNKLRNNSGRQNRDNKIERFRPTDRDINKYRNIKKFDVKKSDRRTSLKTDKILSRRTDTKNSKRKYDQEKRKNENYDRSFKKDNKKINNGRKYSEGENKSKKESNQRYSRVEKEKKLSGFENKSKTKEKQKIKRNEKRIKSNRSSVNKNKTESQKNSSKKISKENKKRKNENRKKTITREKKNRKEVKRNRSK